MTFTSPAYLESYSLILLLASTLPGICPIKLARPGTWPDPIAGQCFYCIPLAFFILCNPQPSFLKLMLLTQFVLMRYNFWAEVESTLKLTYCHLLWWMLLSALLLFMLLLFFNS